MLCKRAALETKYTYDYARATSVVCGDLLRHYEIESGKRCNSLPSRNNPAVQRINGRVAMWAFLICSLTEVTSGQSVAQQALAHPISATLLGLIISLASVAPKYVSGVPLEELQNTASREGLPEKLRFFNKTHEIWMGRVAMIG